MLSARFKDQADALLYPAAKLLASAGVGPNLLTHLGLAASLGAGMALATGSLGAALLFLLLTGFFDVMDGAVARVTRGVTRFGGFLDSLYDRYSDSVILLGLAVYLDQHHLLVFAVLVGSLMVSYSRSRAENYLPRCDVGIAERAERLIILAAATLVEALGFFPQGEAFLGALVILAFLTHFTVLQRALYARSRL